MRKLLAIALSAPAIACAGEPPAHSLIEEAYFKCEPSKSLQGGIFGKGPTRKFGANPGSCNATEWQRISREEFKKLATQWHDAKWEKDIPFFKDARASSPK